MFSQAWGLVKKISTSILEVLFSTRGYLIFFCLYIVFSNCLIVFFINNIIINHFDLFILLVFWSQLCMFNSFCSYYLTVCLYLSWPKVLPVLSFLLCICCPIGWANCAVDHDQLVPHALLFSLYFCWWFGQVICKLFTFQYASYETLLYQRKQTLPWMFFDHI